MAYPEKRKGKLTGRWQVDFVIKGHRYNPPAFETMGEADGYEAYVRASGSEPPAHAKHKTTGTTFREVAELCKSAGGPRKGKWKAGRDHSVMQRLDLVCDRIGDLDISAVGTQELDKLVSYLQARPGYQGRKALAAGTINRYLTAASAVLSFASSRGFIVGRPVVPLQDEDGERTETVAPELEDAVVGALKASGQAREADCVTILIETGLRLGELYIISPEQVGNEWIRLHARQTKTSKAREVFLDAELADTLRQMLAAGEMPKEYQLRRHFKGAVKTCGGSAELVLHSLRHTRATRLLQHGIDGKIVMEMLGWTSVATMHRYQHVNSQMHAEAAKKASRTRGDFGNSGLVLPMRRALARKEINRLEATSGIEPDCTVLQTDV